MSDIKDKPGHIVLGADVNVYAHGEKNTLNGKPIPSMELADMPALEHATRAMLSEIYAEGIIEKSAVLGLDPADRDSRDLEASSGDDVSLDLYFDSLNDVFLIEGDIKRELKGKWVPRKHSKSGMPVIDGKRFVYTKSADVD